MDICSAPGLLPKIMAPIYSNTLIQDIGNSGAWADVVSGSFKVLHRLICAPGETSRSLRLEISSRDEPAVSNLQMILDQGNRTSQELIEAMKILTELASDPSIELPEKTAETFIKKQLEAFLAAEGEQAPATLSKPIKAMAGRTLVLLSSNSKTNSNFIMKAYDNDNLVPLTGLPDDKNTVAHLTQVTEDKKTLTHLTEASEDNNNVSHLTELTGYKKNTVARLTELLDATNNITYRIIAAEILESLCIQCDLDKQVMEDTLLPKVSVKICLSIYFKHRKCKRHGN